ncbi:MAG: hypothetical protein ACO1NU_17070 [Arcticibacter sp.]
MKYGCFFLLCIIFLGGCTSDQKQLYAEGQDSTRTDSASANKQLDSLPWNTTYNETTQKLQLDHSGESMKGVGYEEIIRMLNKKYPGIQMEYRGMQGDTIITRIQDATQLTQNIGTSGAESYLAEATFSLTEIPTIKAVKIEFEEGDHAMPGTFTRTTFKDFN